MFAVAAVCGVNLDVKAAYRAVGIDPSDALYHAAVLDAVHVVFLRLSFGGAQSPVIFTRLLDVTLRRFRASMPATRAALYQFVDDSNPTAVAPLTCLLQTEALILAFLSDGWWLASLKTFVYPAAILYATGVSANLPGRTVAVHESKSEKALALLQTLTRPLDSAIAASVPVEPDSTAAPFDLRPWVDQPRLAVVSTPLPVDGPVLTSPHRPITVYLAPLTPPDLAAGFPHLSPTPLDASSPASDLALRTRPTGSPTGQPTIAIVIVCRDEALAQDTVASIDHDTLAGRAVIAIYPAQLSRQPEPDQPFWFDPVDTIPATITLRRRRPLPPACAAHLPVQTGTRLDLNPVEWHALGKVLGYLAYFKATASFIGFWRAALAPLHRTGTWSHDTAAAFDAVHALLHVIHRWEADVDACGPELTIKPDASAAGWGCSTMHPDGTITRRAGVIRATARAASSTGREAHGARDAARSSIAAHRGALGTIRICPDNLPLVSSGTGRCRIVPTVRVLMTFAAYAVQGLPVIWEHESRSHADHAAPDALSVATLPRPWALRTPVLSWLFDTIGGWDTDITGSDGQSTTRAYATITSGRLTGADRLRVMNGIACSTPPSAPDQRITGWQAPLTSFVPAPGEVLFANPLWSELGTIVTEWERMRTPIVVIAPQRANGDWWHGSLARLIAAATRTIALPPRSQQAPSGDPLPRDPRPLAAYVLPGAVPSTAAAPRPNPQAPPWHTGYCKCRGCGDIHTPGAKHRGTPPGWDRECLCECGDVHPHPGPTSAEVKRALAQVARGGGPQSAPAHATAAPAARPPPAPPPQATTAHAPRPSAPSRAAGSSHPPSRQPRSCSGADVRAALAQAHRSDQAPAGRPPRSPAPPPSTASAPTATVPPQGAPASTRPGTPSGTAPAPAAAAPPPAHATMRTWCEDMLRVAAGLNPTTDSSASAGQPDAPKPGDIAPANAGALGVARGVAALKANIGSSKPCSLPEMLRAFAEHRRVLDWPWSPAQAEVFVLDFSQQRLANPPILGWQRVNQASCVEADASRIAAASRRAGYQVPAYCGPKVKAWCRSKGSADKPENSAAFPIRLAEILAAEVPTSHADRDVWESLVMMSFYCLRTGVIPHLYSDMFLPYDGGHILVWQLVQKRTTVDPTSDDACSRAGAIGAARHPIIHNIINQAAGNHRLFPDVTPARMNAFVRRMCPEVGPAFDIRAYGCRTGADRDASTLLLPDDLTRTLFWWKRDKPDMRAYYGAVNVHLLYLFSERRAAIRMVSLVPGLMNARAAHPSHLDWVTPIADPDTLPPAPPMERILATYKATAPSLAVTRRVRAKARAARARGALGLDKAPAATNPVAAVMEGFCCMCFDYIEADEDAAACEACDEIACEDCAEVGHDFHCPAHRPATRRPTASGAGATQAAAKRRRQ